MKTNPPTSVHPLLSVEVGSDTNFVISCTKNTCPTHIASSAIPPLTSNQIKPSLPNTANINKNLGKTGPTISLPNALKVATNNPHVGPLPLKPPPRRRIISLKACSILAIAGSASK